MPLISTDVQSNVRLIYGYLNPVMRKPGFFAKSKGADQLRDKSTADLGLYFRYLSTIPLLPKADISSL